jgi:predicted choloylglycine hydrolase
VQAAYNLTIVDRGGAAATAQIGPDRPPAVAPVAVATNHQETLEWPEHATAFASVEREQRLLELLGDAADPVAPFLEPPLYARAFAAGFGTLYTAVHRPADASVEYVWPGAVWRQSIGAFEEGELTVTLATPRARCSSSRA